MMIHVPPHVTNEHLRDDIRKKKGNNVVILRKRRYFSYKKYSSFFVTKSFLSFCLVITLVLYTSHIPFLKADSVTFYAKACLGGYGSPKNAEGKPETAIDANKESFDIENSAYLSSQKNADLFCGNFDGDVEEGSRPQNMTLTLYLTNKEDVVISTTTKINAKEEDAFLNVLDATNTPIVHDDKSNIKIESESVNVEDKAKEKKDEEAASLTFPLFSALFSHVHAEDDVPLVVPSQGEQSAPPLPILQEDTSLQTSIKDEKVKEENKSDVAVPIVKNEEVATTSEMMATSSTPFIVEEKNKDNKEDLGGILSSIVSLVHPDTTSVSATSVSTTTNNPEFEVLYSTDNESWSSLAFLGKENSKTVTIKLPYTPSTWKDITSLQVQIKALQTFEKKSDLYVDGMSLTVTYDTPEKKDESREYHVGQIENTNEDFSVGINGDKRERVLLDFASTEKNGMAIYDLETEALLMTTEVTSATSTIDPNGALPEYGSFLAVLTGEDDWCSAKTMKECVMSEKEKSVSFFTISAHKDIKEGETVKRKKIQIRTKYSEKKEETVIATSSAISTLDQKENVPDTLQRSHEATNE